MSIYILSDHTSISDEITSSIRDSFTTVQDPHKALVALILVKKPIKVISNMLAKYRHLAIITTMIPHDFNNDRVFFLTSRIKDMSINCFVNYLWPLRSHISHIDTKMCYSNKLNVKTEIMEALSVVSMLVDIAPMNIRISLNDWGAHVSGYDERQNLTTSCYVNKNSTYNSFYEQIEVIMRDGQRYALRGSDELGQHTYEERYGAAWQTIVKDTLNRNRYYQQKLTMIILKVKGPTGTPNETTTPWPEGGRDAWVSGENTRTNLPNLPNRGLNCW